MADDFRLSVECTSIEALVNFVALFRVPSDADVASLVGVTQQLSDARQPLKDAVAHAPGGHGSSPTPEAAHVGGADGGMSVG